MRSRFLVICIQRARVGLKGWGGTLMNDHHHRHMWWLASFFSLSLSLFLVGSTYSHRVEFTIVSRLAAAGERRWRTALRRFLAKHWEAALPADLFPITEKANPSLQRTGNLEPECVPLNHFTCPFLPAPSFPFALRNNVLPRHLQSPSNALFSSQHVTSCCCCCCAARKENDVSWHGFGWVRENEWTTTAKGVRLRWTQPHPHRRMTESVRPPCGIRHLLM